MVKVSPGVWSRTLELLDQGTEKSEIVGYLLNQDYSLLEAQAIYKKAKAEYRKPQKKKKKNIGYELSKPKHIIYLSSLLIGILFPMLHLSLLQRPFGFFWGIPWMVYVFGKWIFCLITGNLPGMFHEIEGIMVTRCNYLGNNTEMIKTIFSMGGIVFTLVLGSLLVLFMVNQSRRYYHDNETKLSVKLKKYFHAFINGAIGFGLLTSMTYLLLTGMTAEVFQDFRYASQVLNLGLYDLLNYAIIFCWIAWAFTIVASTIMFWKQRRLIPKQ